MLSRLGRQWGAPGQSGLRHVHHHALCHAPGRCAPGRVARCACRSRFSVSPSAPLRGLSALFAPPRRALRSAPPRLPAPGWEPNTRPEEACKATGTGRSQAGLPSAPTTTLAITARLASRAGTLARADAARHAGSIRAELTGLTGSLARSGASRASLTLPIDAALPGWAGSLP